MKHPQVQIETNFWNIILELYPESAPLAVENFMELTKKWYYDGIIFHRVIRDFMIQGWDPTGTGMWGKSMWFRPFKDEFDPNLTHTKWVISMANAWKNTNGSQFFIVTAEDASFLDGKHTIFGKVIEWMDTVLDIERIPTDRNDRPNIEAVMQKVSVIS